ncbi:hypothetical protein B0H67DRAFT_491118 [Lasiosphaeris hirsuta]|uniref:AB hydrolase-1 domain-containing protein n=1 Tax=Lasiosphaeris hirsuta TaxID=260670 RepID=A0AA40A9X1_9PEZI|nr:hypothetical protein B0H67DRAFT_491118 [Lasiosphaeris hirsuta]
MTALVDYVNDPRFSQTFELPANPHAARGGTGPFKVTYADFGYHHEGHPEEDNVILFFSPLMASRLVQIAKDELAKKHKIRVIVADRPGFGGTDDIETKDKLSRWSEVIPSLLAHLGIQHVSVACHSGGTIWALDLLLHHPHLLHPTRTYLAMGAPWILPSHSSLFVPSLLKVLPAGLIGHTDKFARLFNNHIAPAFASSLGLSQALGAKLSPASAPATVPRSEGGGQGGDDDNGAPEGAQFEDDVFPKIIERIYAEGMSGISSEAVLLLQKVEGMAGWGDWADYDELVPRLVGALGAAGRRLRVDVFYGERDVMIGDAGSKGPAWLDRCWGELGGNVVDYRSRVVEGADHDGVWNLRWGAVQEVFGRVASLGEAT